MLDALKMLAKPGFLVFIICSTLICIPLAYYYAQTSVFLSNMGFKQPASAMSIGQMSEIFFMLLIPFFFRKLGVKWMIIIGMAAWSIRYLLFAYGAPEQIVWMLFLGIALHGICYDFFFVTGFMYTDSIAPKAVRGQAQSMLVFFTQGVGMYFGYQFAGHQLAPVKPKSDALSSEIASHSNTVELTYFEQFGQMFSVDTSEKISPSVLAEASNLWKDYWTLPAYIAAGIMVIFAITFWDKVKTDEE